MLARGASKHREDIMYEQALAAAGIAWPVVYLVVAFYAVTRGRRK